MQWHQERQRVLAENVANAETPGFRPRDLAAPKFEDRLQPTAPILALARSDPGHLGASASGGAGEFAVERRSRSAVRPTGNAVSLEDEMLKVAANQMDYQAATTLYGKSLGLIKTALGKR